MIVAVALFGEEISPRLDCCTGLLVADGGDEKRFDLRGATCLDRLETVVAQAPAVLLCGGIRRCDYYFLVQSSVQVITGLSGLARDRLVELTDGTLVFEDPEPINQAQLRCERLRRKDKEADMPGQNGTGPLGKGPMTGGGRGRCRRRPDATDKQGVTVPTDAKPNPPEATESKPEIVGVGRGGRPRRGGQGKCHGGGRGGGGRNR